MQPPAAVRGGVELGWPRRGLGAGTWRPQALPHPADPLTAPVQWLVQCDIIREQLLRHLVIPVGQQPGDHLLGAQGLRPGTAGRRRRPADHCPGSARSLLSRRHCARGRPALGRRGLQHLLHKPGGQHGCARVGAVGQHDHAEAGLRVPAHVTAEARVTAAVVDEPSPGAGLLGEQPEPVSVLAARGGISREPRLRLRQDHGGLLHLPPGGRGQRMGIAAPLAPRREGRGKAVDPAGQVTDRTEYPAHRGERAITVRGDFGPAAGTAGVSAGQPGWVELGGLEPGPRHGERAKDPIAHEVGVVSLGHGRDDPPEHRVAQVGVLETGARRPGRAHPPGQDRREIGQRGALLPVTPRVIGREARGHREQMPKRDGR